jgi:arginyl-tRNA synthetase
MNIFDYYLKKLLKIIIDNHKKLNIDISTDLSGVVIETPPQEFQFDLSTNISLVLAKKSKQNPRTLALIIKELLLENLDDFSIIDIAGPGFLNFKLTNEIYQKILLEILDAGNKFGKDAKKMKYNIEFVSANPTGPMHVGHCRGAIFGDVLSNLLIFNGNEVTKEYYINDYGNQVTHFTESVYLRLREIRFNEKFIKKENLYPGEYVISIAKNILKDNPDIALDNFDQIFDYLSTECLKHSMNLIKNDLQELGIRHDNFVSEKLLVQKNLVEKSINQLKKNNFVEEGYLEPPKGEDSMNWKKTKRLIFKSTLFGDDSDRALQKNDGTWTYFANDIAYHSDKVSRKYNYLINILGADHTGYIKRITSAVKALSNNSTSLNCKVCQLVKLFKNGEPYKMSKRSGDFISVKDLLLEVDKDAIRFMMLNRSNDVELDFDFDKILEKNKENPIFYVQYCYARINSIFRTLNIESKDSFKIDKKNFFLNNYEVDLFKKIIDWPKVIKSASEKLEPHKIPFYLYELATIFHSYWSKGNDDTKYKFIENNKIKSKNTLLVIKLVAMTIENGMNILGVNLPKKM